MLQLDALDVSVVVDPEGGGRITRITVAGRELLTPAGCFLMAPWAGRTGYGCFEHEGIEHRLPVDAPPHAIHGTARGVSWQVDERSHERAVLSATLGPVWPWRGRCVQEIVVHDTHVELAASVHAADGEPAFPAVLGWHPWLVKPASVDLRAAAMLERGSDGLPTGTRVRPAPRPGDRPFDDCFEDVDWPVVVRWADGFQVEIDAEGCRYAVLYDEQIGTTCVEPQTAPPDALRTGEATLVEPGRSLRATTRLSWR